MHNDYRRGVRPTATNMKEMVRCARCCIYRCVMVENFIDLAVLNGLLALFVVVVVVVAFLCVCLCVREHGNNTLHAVYVIAKC